MKTLNIATLFSTKRPKMLVIGSISLVLATSLIACSKPSAPVQSTVVEPTTIQLRVLETTDLHANIMDYNYYTGESDPTIGLARTASLIKQARAEVTNSVLVDNGDLLQGSPLGDYVAHTGIAAGDIHPIYQALNTLNYDVATLGNHEFNYGLDFMYQAIAGANFPYISANLYCAAAQCGKVKQGEHLYAPYLIKSTEVTDNHGQKQQLNIGYIGFVPPQILLWDKQHLQDQVRVDSITETAAKLVPEMKAQGADLIIALAHSGIGQTSEESDPQAENLVFALTQVPGIDTVVFGHSHSIFPDARYADLPNTDINKGLMNGIPAVMPGRWGDHLGVVDFTLVKQENGWQVSAATSKALPVFDNKTHQPLVEADKQIHQAIAKAHQGTIEFMQRPIGQASADMYSFLSQIQDDPTVQIVADAQIARVKALLTPELQHLPVLSAAAPFKAGGRRSTGSDAEQYIQVPKGVLSFRNAADLYLYPNTLVAVKVTGAELKDWLECSANQFMQIDLGSSEPQQLINIEHPTYNFDVIDGVSYQIDVSQPAKYSRNCDLVNADASRIVNLSYTDEHNKVWQGEAFANKEFIVATNNYRAFTGRFAGTGSDHVVLELPDANREALVAYIGEQSQYDAASGQYLAAVNPSADNNWSLLPLSSKVVLDIRFQSRNSVIAEAFINEKQFWPMEKLGTDALGFAEYRIQLQH